MIANNKIKVYIYSVIRLIIIEDDETIRKNLVLFTDFQSDIEGIGGYGSVEDFLRRPSSAADFDILLLDIGLPGISGLDALPQIKLKYPHIDIIMLTAYDDENKIVRALKSGACSYLSKSTSLDKIMESIRIVFSGGSYMSPSIARKLSEFMSGATKTSSHKLTPKQEQVMQCLIDGLSYKQIASELGLSIDTIRTHIKRIYLELHVSNKAAAVAKYLKDQ